MLLDTQVSGEFTYGLEPVTGAATGLRFLGVGASGAGFWSLPEIGPDVPQSLTLASQTLQSLAQFSLMLHEQGLRLPAEEFTTLNAAVALQIINTPQVKKLAPPMQLPLHSSLEVHEHDGQALLLLRGHAKSDLPLYRLKETVERLNQVQQGLGWIVTDALQMSHSASLRLYEPSLCGAYAEMYYFYGASSDEEYAAMALEGTNPTPEEMDDFLGSNISMDGFADAFGGHRHLLNWEEKPNIPAKQNVKFSRIRWDALTPDDTQLLKAARRFVTQTKQVRKQTDPFCCEDSSANFGALAYVVWDDPDVCFEIVDAAERDAYECGEGEEIIFDLRTELDKPETWPAFIAAYKAQMGLYAALCDFLRHLPKEET